MCASGCFGPMYNPNGPWGAPGFSQYNYPTYGYPTQGGVGSFQTLTPGSQYIPGGTVDPGSNVGPTPTYQGSGGDAAPYGGGSSVPVPTPSDPNSPYFPSPNENYSAPRSGASAAPVDDAPPFSAIPQRESESLMGRGPALTGPHNSDAMIRPVGMSQPSQTQGVANSDYGFDGDGYAWLEGVVSFDAADRTWNIVYNVDPTTEDQYAGHFTLSPSPLLRTFRQGERVRLEGRVDPVERDQFGKATYLPVRIIRGAA